MYVTSIQIQVWQYFVERNWIQEKIKGGKKTQMKRSSQLICLTAYQLLMGYLMPKFDLFVKVCS